jgi:SAM-dependent methyltransferase
MPSPDILRGQSGAELVACNLCGESRASVVFRKNLWGTDYTIVRCDACGLVYVNPRAFAVKTDEYYKGAYLETIERHGRLDPGVEFIYRETMQRLQAFLHPGRLLDVGCGMGHFMNYARREGWDVCGVEASRFAAEWGRNRFGVRTHPVVMLGEARFPDSYVDAAVMIETIQQSSDPTSALAETFRILKPGGVLCLTTPNFHCYRSLLMREAWAPIIPSGHLYYFTAETLTRMMHAAGFGGVMDLTKNGSFEEDLAFARAEGRLRLSEAELAELRQRLALEDAPKLANQRGEGLIFCGRKPFGGPEALWASLRNSELPTEVEGKLAQSRIGDTDRIFYVSGGVKYWVTSPERMAARGLRMPDDIHVVDRLDFLPEGPVIQ